MDNVQKCSRCQEVKALELFARLKAGSEVRNRYCLVCSRDYRRERYGKFPAPNPRTKPGDPLPVEWRCPKCRIMKPVADYFRKASAPKGFETPCKSCMRESERVGPRRDTIQRYRQTLKGKTSLGIVSHRYHARKRALASSLTFEEWQRAVEYFGGACAYCGQECAPVQEHFIPVTADGPYTAENIIPACTSCNCSKQDRMPQDWCSPEAYQRILAYFASLV